MAEDKRARLGQQRARLGVLVVAGRAAGAREVRRRETEGGREVRELERGGQRYAYDVACQPIAPCGCGPLLLVCAAKALTMPQQRKNERKEWE